jgi:uncharacterized protein (DUF2141 family)
MDWGKYSLAFLIVVLLSSCGQVGVITGGDVDTQAPKPIEEETSPLNASRNIFPEKIIIPFDEFIALNKPAQNIRVIPNDVNLNYSIKGKSLILEKESGEWEQNTTYSIYLNRAVQDITAKNDSIFSYVFSTGNSIDSLVASFFVKDAYENKPQNDITVGLFEQELLNDTSNIEPRYFSTTDKEGKAGFQYLKAGEFFVYAFKDENRNNRMDSNEKRGKVEGIFSPKNTTDSIPPIIKLMPAPVSQVEVRSNEFTTPGIWSIGFNRSLPDSYEVSYDNPIILDTIWNATKDSLQFFIYNSLSGSLSFFLQRDSILDTISKRFFFKNQPKLEGTDNLQQSKLAFNDSLVFKWNDPIKAIDSSKINASYLVDSNKISFSPSFELLELNELRISGIDRGYDKALITIPPDVITGYNASLLDTIKLDISLGKEKELGNLVVKLDTIPEYGLLTLIDRKGVEVERRILTGDSTVTFNYLNSGKYTFSLLIDENENLRWDTGDIFLNIPAEKYFKLPESTTVRSNWDVETTLNIKEVLNPSGSKNRRKLKR